MCMLQPHIVVTSTQAIYFQLRVQADIKTHAAGLTLALGGICGALSGLLGSGGLSSMSVLTLGGVIPACTIAITCSSRHLL